MISKILLLICLQTLLIKVISSQCINGLEFANGGYGPAQFFYDRPCGFAASSGGGFQVTSFSPLAPTGLSVVSENVIEGPVFVRGLLPFLAAVALEGSFPSAGMGCISYGCGEDVVGIVSEGPIATGIVGPYGPAGPGVCGTELVNGLGYGPGVGFGPGFPYGPGIGIPAYGPILAGFNCLAPACDVFC